MTTNTAAIVEASVQRLFPNRSRDEVLAELLLERAQRHLIRYQAMAHRFEARYQRDFAAFRQEIVRSQPGAEAEQDYFDWELAITGISDMQEEIARLSGLVPQP